MDPTTSTNDRFGKLFESIPKPNLDSDEASTVAPPAVTQKTTTVDWGRFAKDVPAAEEGSEDDDYLNAFEKKPQMNLKNVKPHRRVLPAADAHGYRKDQIREPLLPLQYLPLGKNNTNDLAETDGAASTLAGSLPNKDRFGNQSTGHFCVFSLVQKFPYKYMNDGNDRVSRRFFASDRFFERKWDM